MLASDIPTHAFTANILAVLETHFGENATAIFQASPVLGYLNHKTKAANRGSKARGAFANHYALYVLVEDYIHKGFAAGRATKAYSQYEGARYSDLFTRQRQLPFGAKLQNHALNSRLNDEFKKFYPTVGKPLIVRDVESQRYWIQDDLLQVRIRQKDGKDYDYNIAAAIMDVIDAYVATKKAAFEEFLQSCQQMDALASSDPEQAIRFVAQQLQPNVDARIFEIVSFAILKATYGQQAIWMGNTKDTVSERLLRLYKTGRTNANDGGIDFVLKPLGRFFQVTETIDVHKYFLDIDKVQRFPITFVVKTEEAPVEIRATIRKQAVAKYKIEPVVNAYMNAIEDIFNIQCLKDCFQTLVQAGRQSEVMAEIIIQSKLEFNYADDEEELG
ncbi:MAG: hypothetical protein RLZZ612_2277 [Pseudomonadota bacterium]|jgi:hypothetical protein